MIWGSTSASTGSWEAYYLDGRTADRRRVTISLMASGLQISTESGTTLWWPYNEIRQTQGFYAGEQVRLERGGEIAETLLISDLAFLTRLYAVAPELAKRFHNPATRRIRVELTILAALAVIGIILALYFWGIPVTAALVAPHVPVSWEESLGRATTEHIVERLKRCLDPERTRAIDEIVATLVASGPKSPYTFRITVADSRVVNALAAPGGYIVIFRGLVERTRSPEELAGVLAHELQHVIQRHATRLVLQHASTGILIAALSGDVSGAAAFGLETARTLGTLRYSREYEQEADVNGMRMLIAARIDPAGMISFFDTLEKEGGKTPALLKYVSTHPSTEDRIARLKSLARELEGPPVKLLKDYDWEDARKICQAE